MRPRIDTKTNNKGLNMINKDAFELVVNNMRETPTNNKKTFARYALEEPMGEFEKRLMDAWTIADGDNQERLSIAFPQIACAILDCSALLPKKREKYLRKLLNQKDEK
jgi:hypothetical protein